MPPSVFEDRNRERALERLGIVDGHAPGRLRDPLAPADVRPRRDPRAAR
jgi:hypothetical protein